MAPCETSSRNVDQTLPSTHRPHLPRRIWPLSPSSLTSQHPRHRSDAPQTVRPRPLDRRSPGSRARTPTVDPLLSILGTLSPPLPSISLWPPASRPPSGLPEDLIRVKLDLAFLILSPWRPASTRAALPNVCPSRLLLFVFFCCSSFLAPSLHVLLSKLIVSPFVDPLLSSLWSPSGQNGRRRRRRGGLPLCIHPLPNSVWKTRVEKNQAKPCLTSLTAFLHEAEKVVQELFTLFIVVQVVKLKRRERNSIISEEARRLQTRRFDLLQTVWSEKRQKFNK